MNYTTEQKRNLIETAQLLMKKAEIAIRDTWDGYEGENYDDLILNNYRTDGPKSIDFIETEDGLARFTPKGRNELPGFKSIAYEKAQIFIPKKLKNKTHPIIHEIVHFLQHTTLELDEAWKGLVSHTKEDFRMFVKQPAELEAHFVQLLYIDQYEWKIEDEELRKEFKTYLTEALTDKSKRVELIVYAKDNGIL